MRTLAFATLACVAALSAGAPAFAQDVGELTVTGRGTMNGEPRNLSEVVSYGDLDLTRMADQDILKTRVKDTAGRLCKDMNEPAGVADRMGASCEAVAVREALAQVKLAIADAPAMAMADAAMPPPAPMAEPAPAAPAYSEPASATVTTTTVTNGPVPDTAENRARYGSPMSNAGKRTAAAGN